MQLLVVAFLVIDCINRFHIFVQFDEINVSAVFHSFA